MYKCHCFLFINKTFPFLSSEVSRILKNSGFWDVTPCSPSKVSQHFESTCRPYHPSWRGGDMFLWNVCRLSMNCMPFILEDITHHNHRCKNLKSCVGYMLFKVSEYAKNLSCQPPSLLKTERMLLEFLPLFASVCISNRNDMAPTCIEVCSNGCGFAVLTLNMTTWACSAYISQCKYFSNV
jgi:hypothetical protein